MALILGRASAGAIALKEETESVISMPAWRLIFIFALIV
jgi:hypothetical protein